VDAISIVRGYSFPKSNFVFKWLLSVHYYTFRNEEMTPLLAAVVVISISPGKYVGIAFDKRGPDEQVTTAHNF
jgi:hypothetical protein